MNEPQKIKIDLGKPLLIVKGSKGYLGCGYLDKQTIEKVGDAAAIITGVNSIEEMLEKEVSWVSPAAKALGVKERMKGNQAIEKLL